MCLPSTKASTPIAPAEYTPDAVAELPRPAIVPPVAKIMVVGSDLRKCRKGMSFVARIQEPRSMTTHALKVDW
jgi:hypothetical protein